MKTLHLPQRDETLFILFGISWITLGWFLLVLALFGLFVAPVILVGALILGTAILFLGWKFLARADWTARGIFAAIFLLSVLLSSSASPTIFSGRDQGAISEASIRLAQNGELAFRFPASDAFFAIYGPGQALNFPGFSYTESGDLITQFPLAYTSWLAGFYALFGLTGLQAANGVLLFLFLASLYQLLRGLAHPFFAAGGTVLAAGSFLPLWFGKFTLTENLAVFLFTFLALCLSSFLKKGNFIAYIGALLTGGLFAFTRIEGYAVLGLTLVFFLCRQEGRALWKTYPWKSLVVPGIIFFFFFLRNFFMNLPYYKMIGKALIKFLGGFGSDVVSAGHSFSVLGSRFPVGSALILYGILPLFLAGFLGILILWREKRWNALLPLFLALPTLLYLFAPNITLDHPWMLRRYYFSLFPSLLVSAVLGFALLIQKQQKLSLADAPAKSVKMLFPLYIGILLLFSAPAVTRFAWHQENAGLLPQIERFSQEFGQNDLILIDRQSTGNGYAMATGPLSFLYSRQAVYFFNPEDLTKLDYSRFSHVYLVAPEENTSRYAAILQDRMIFRGNFTFTREELAGGSLSLQASLAFPSFRAQETKNHLFQVY